MSSRVTVAILAGGQSRRMGTDKSFVVVEGKPLLQHVIDRVGRLGYPAVLIANDIPRYQAFGLPVYADVIPGAGALGGLYTALTHSATGYTLCLACDMPRVSPALLAHLISLADRHDAIVPRVGGVAQALHAIYHRRCLPVMEARIRRGELRISELLGALSTRFVEEDELRRFDPHGASFANLNTPRDVAEWVKNR